ncbi:MAG: hypothetical protein BJ554DRAFT_3629, partial [Olpidium bornovanus]
RAPPAATAPPPRPGFFQSRRPEPEGPVTSKSWPRRKRRDGLAHPSASTLLIDGYAPVPVGGGAAGVPSLPPFAAAGGFSREGPPEQGAGRRRPALAGHVLPAAVARRPVHVARRRRRAEALAASDGAAPLHPARGERAPGRARGRGRR